MGSIIIPTSSNLPPLEAILSGLVLDERVVYTSRDRGGRDSNIGAVVIPVRYERGQLKGYFVVEGSVRELPIGFRHDLDSVVSFLELEQNNFIVRPIHTNFVYLPLDETGLLISNPSRQGTVASSHPEVFSFHIGGIKKGQTVYPLFLAFQGDSTVKGMYIGNGGRPTIFEPNLSSKSAIEVATAIRMGNLNTLRPLKEISCGPSDEFDCLNPRSIVNYLDQSVVGQTEAKRTLAVAFSNYMRRTQTGDDGLPRDYNTLLIGPSGVGKTLMARLLSEKASVPFISIQLVGKSSEGYVGQNFQSVLYDLISAQTDSAAPQGVVFLDEFDKLAQGPTGYFGVRLQDELIGLIEGGSIQRYGKRIETHNLMFIAAGAFQGSSGHSLYEMVRASLPEFSGNGLGFTAQRRPARGADSFDVLSRVTPQHLIDYGLKPELIGRVGEIAVLHSLTVQDKVRILRDMQDSPIRQYEYALRTMGYDVRIDPDIPELFASLTNPETGARDLKTVTGRFFRRLVFDPSQYSNNGLITINRELVCSLVPEYAARANGALSPRQQQSAGGQ